MRSRNENNLVLMVNEANKYAGRKTQIGAAAAEGLVGRIFLFDRRRCGQLFV